MVLAILLAVLGGAFGLMVAEPAQSPAEPVPMRDIASSAAVWVLRGGEWTVSPGAVNTLIARMNPQLPADAKSVQAVRTGADSVTVQAVVVRYGRSWTVTAEGQIAVTHGETATVTFTPTRAWVGRLPVPSARSQLGEIAFDLPIDAEIRAAENGLVLTLPTGVLSRAATLIEWIRSLSE